MCVHRAQDHTDEVTAATVHASGDYFVTASLDRTWALYDVQSGLCITQVPVLPQSGHASFWQRMPNVTVIMHCMAGCRAIEVRGQLYSLYAGAEKRKVV